MTRFRQCTEIIERLMLSGKYPFTYPPVEPYKKWDEYAKFYLRSVEIYKPPHGSLKRKLPRKIKKSLQK